MGEAPVTLPVHEPAQWPLRLTWREVSHIAGCSRATLFRHVGMGRLPRPDGDRLWSRAAVQGYLADERHRAARRA